MGGYLLLTALLFAVGGLLVNMSFASGVREHDVSTSQWLVEHRTAWLDTLTEIVSRSADTLGIVFAVVLVELALWVSGRRREMLLIAVGLAAELSVFLTVNHLVDRPRPEVAPLGSVPGTFSFPSGHTAAAVVLWMTVALLAGGDVAAPARRPRLERVLAVLALVIVVGVGFSRVYRGMHHPTDVVAGALLGTGCLVVAAVALRVANVRVDVPSADRRTDPVLEVAS